MIRRLLALLMLLFSVYGYSQTQLLKYRVGVGAGGVQQVLPTSMDVGKDGSTITVGYYRNTIDFNPSAVGTYTLYGDPSSYVYMFILKLDSLGQFIWAKSLLMNAPAYPRVKLDSVGNIYIAGAQYSVVDYDPGPAVYNVPGIMGGQRAGFLLKLNLNGDFRWVKTYYNGGYNNDFLDVGIIGKNVFVTGQGEVASVGTVPYIIKYDTSGNQHWFKAIPGSYAGGNRIAIDKNTKTIWTLTGAGYSGALAYITRIDSMGVIKFTKQVTAANHLGGWDIATDKNNSVVLVGSYEGVMDANPDPVLTYTLSSSSTASGFVIKLDSTGTFVWAHKISSPSEYMNAESVYVKDNLIYIAGGDAQILQLDGVTLSPSPIYAGPDISDFYLVLNSAGQYVWCSQMYVNYHSSNKTYDIEFDPQGFLYSINDIDFVGIVNKFYACMKPGKPIVTSDTLICSPGNSVTINLSSEGTIKWYATASSTLEIGQGNSFITPSLSVGDYYYYAESSTCMKSDRAQIHLLVRQSPTLTVNSGSVCAGEPFVINPSGAATYTYSSGSSTVNPTVNSTYTISGANTSGCMNSVTSSVMVSPLPVFSVNSGIICAGQVFTITPSGSFIYTYSSGSSTVSPLSTSSYTISGADANGCVNSAISSVTVNPLPVIAVNSGSVCPGKTFTLTPSGALTYTYSSGNSIVNPMSNTTYTISGTNVNGCVNSVISSVMIYPIALAVNSGAICIGQTFTMNPSGAATYTYSSGSPVVAPTTGTLYTVSGTSAAGCLSSVISSVTVNPKPTITANSGSICAGQAYTFSPSGALTYTYSSGSAIVSPTISTSYVISGTDVNGCTNSTPGSVIVKPVPGITVNSGLVCAGHIFTITPGGASTYTFSSGSNTVNPSGNTSYTVTGTGANGCVNTIGSISNVTVVALPTIIAAVTSTSVCAGTSIMFTASGATTYTWTNGVLNNIPYIPSATAIYTVTGVSNGCTSTSTLQVIVNICTAVEKLILDDDGLFTIYPNPANSSVTIHSTAVLERIELISLTGQMMLSERVYGNQYQLSLTEVTDGIYVIRIFSSGVQTACKKLVIQK